MGLTELPDESPGAPWEPALAGRLDKLVVESETLAGNPLGDPTRRPLYVYTPPGHGEGGRRYPTIYLLHGYSGQIDMWGNREAFEPNLFERVDALFSGVGARRAIVVFVDGWTSLGGSQFINSNGHGRYMDHICDEIVPFVDERYQTVPDRDHRAVMGKSSGGYGAMVLSMLRPEVFGALATLAGDALFEASFIPEFSACARILRDHFEGSYEVFFERLKQREVFDFSLYGTPLMLYAMGAAYSADPDGTVLLPFELDTGRLVPEVWERWLAWDPVRMAPDHLDALRSMRTIYIDAGSSDEYNLDLGARAFAKELSRGGVEHSLELVPGGHRGGQHRYPKVMSLLGAALTP